MKKNRKMIKAAKKVDWKRFEGDVIGFYTNPVNGKTYRNATIVKVVPPGRKLTKKYAKVVGHHPSYTPYRRPYASAVVRLEDGRHLFPRISIEDMVK